MQAAGLLLLLALSALEATGEAVVETADRFTNSHGLPLLQLLQNTQG